MLKSDENMGCKDGKKGCNRVKYVALMGKYVAKNRIRAKKILIVTFCSDGKIYTSNPKEGYHCKTL